MVNAKLDIRNIPTSTMKELIWKFGKNTKRIYLVKHASKNKTYYLMQQLC